jgi:hypothetical protein
MKGSSLPSLSTVLYSPIEERSLGMTRYLHCMIRVTDPEVTIRFFKLIGLSETRRIENEKGRFTLLFLAADEDREAALARRAPEVELTWNWDPEPYSGGRRHQPPATRWLDGLCLHIGWHLAGAFAVYPIEIRGSPISAWAKSAKVKPVYGIAANPTARAGIGLPLRSNQIPRRGNTCMA